MERVDGGGAGNGGFALGERGYSGPGAADGRGAPTPEAGKRVPTGDSGVATGDWKRREGRADAWKRDAAWGHAAYNGAAG